MKPVHLPAAGGALSPELQGLIFRPNMKIIR
jgi:hypothetical protein